MDIRRPQRFTAPLGEAGATMVEYGLLAALLAVVSLASITAVQNAATHEIETMAAGMSTSVTIWKEDDGGSGGGSTTTTTLPPPPPTTTTTTTTTTTLPPPTTTTTTTTIPKPIIKAEGDAMWDETRGNWWHAIAVFHNTWDENVVVTIEIVTTAADGKTSTTTKETLGFDKAGNGYLSVESQYNKKDYPKDQIEFVEFRVIAVTTKPIKGEGVTYETKEPVVLVKVPE